MRKTVLRILAGTALAVAVAGPAAAVNPPITGGISSNGYVVIQPTSSDISQATSLDFTTVTGTPTPGTPGVLSSYGAGSGSFAGVVCTSGSCGTIQDISSLVVGAQSIPAFFVLTGGTNLNPITFNLTGITGIIRSTPGFLDVTASGIFNWSGFSDTPGYFEFSSQGTNITSFSFSAQAVPEPATWGLMLLGFGGIGLAMRRRRKPALAQLA